MSITPKFTPDMIAPVFKYIAMNIIVSQRVRGGHAQTKICNQKGILYLVKPGEHDVEYWYVKTGTIYRLEKIGGYDNWSMHFILTNFENIESDHLLMIVHALIKRCHDKITENPKLSAILSPYLTKLESLNQ